MNRKINKIAVMFIASIFALTGLSVGFAMWSDSLVINVDAESGYLDWEWKDVPELFMFDEDCPPPCYPTTTPDAICDPNYGFYEIADGEGWGPVVSDKNVGCGTATKIDQYTIEVTVNNAYPGYWNGVSTHAHVLGTIPVKIQEAVLSWNPDGSNIIATINAANEGDIFHIDLDGDGTIDMELKWGNNFGNQHEPCEDYEISWNFCFLQSLPQDSTYTMYVTLTAVQWNEYTIP